MRRFFVSMILAPLLSSCAAPAQVNIPAGPPTPHVDLETGPPRFRLAKALSARLGNLEGILNDCQGADSPNDDQEWKNMLDHFKGNDVTQIGNAYLEAESESNKMALQMGAVGGVPIDLCLTDINTRGQVLAEMQRDFP